MKTIGYILLLITLSALVSLSAEAQLVVIVHNDNPLGNIDNEDVKDYYMRMNRSRWPKLNKPIKPVDYRGQRPVRSQFLEEVLGVSNEKLAQHFTQRQFANSEPTPYSFSTEAEVVNYVSNVTGAIGYISLETYEANKTKVKAILVIQ